MFAMARSWFSAAWPEEGVSNGELPAVNQNADWLQNSHGIECAEVACFFFELLPWQPSIWSPWAFIPFMMIHVKPSLLCLLRWYRLRQT